MSPRAGEIGRREGEDAGAPGSAALAGTVRALEAEVETLQAIAGAILSIHDVEQVLLSINGRLLTTLDADIAGAFLIDGDELVMQSCVGHHAMATARLRMRRGQGIAGLVFETGKPHKVDDYVRDETISRDFTWLAEEEEARSALAVPLRVSGTMTGVIEVWRRRPSTFNGEDVRRMQAISTLAAIAIDNARLYESQSGALRELADVRAELEAQLDLLRRSAALQRRLTQLVLDRVTLEELVRTAAEDIDCGALVTAADGTVLSSHPPELAEEEPVRELLEDRARTADRAGRRSVTVELRDGRGVWEEPIGLGLEAVGSVFLIGSERATAFVEAAAGQAAAACALHHLEEEAARRARSEAADQVIWELISDHTEQRRRALSRARRFHLDIDGPRRLVLGTVGLSRAAAAEGWTPAQTDRARQRILDGVRVESRRHGVLGSARDDRIVSLTREDVTGCRAFIEAVTAQVAPVASALPIAWGISGVCADPDRLPQAYEQARAASESARRLRSEGPLAYDELGVVRLLVGSSPGADIDAFLEDVLGPLHRYDRERNGALIATLQAFFDAGCHQKDAAALLFVHPKTLRYRLERIRELAGLDLSRHADRVQADLALQIDQVCARDGRAVDEGAAPT